MNEHRYHITTKKQYIDEANNIYNVDKSKSYNIKNNRYTDEHCYNKKQFITNNLTNYVTTNNSITNTESVFNIKNFSTKHYITNVFRSNNGYIEHNVYKKYDNRTFNNTNTITKHTNNHSNDVTNNFKVNTTSNVIFIIISMVLLH